MGPETPSSDDEGRDQFFQVDERKWCDICGKDVRLEGGLDGNTEKRFRVKIYASNGLMRAGAWAACWREMERVDVELHPFVDGDLGVELEHFAASSAAIPTIHYEAEAEDGFVDEEEAPEIVIDIDDPEELKRMKEEDEMIQKTIMEEEKVMRKKIADEERMREIYGTTEIPTEEHVLPKRRNPPGHEDSLPELIFAALKVAMKDTKNVAILVLSVLVLLLALKPRGVVMADPSPAKSTRLLNTVMANTNPVDTPKTMEAPLRAPEPATLARSSAAPELIQEELPQFYDAENVDDIVAPNPREKASRQVVKPAERTIPAIRQDSIEAAQLEQEVGANVIHKAASIPQDASSNSKQTPAALEIDAAKLQADHNDPDLKEVVPLA